MINTLVFFFLVDFYYYYVPLLSKKFPKTIVFLDLPDRII
jgi:hypothetical protein